MDDLPRLLDGIKVIDTASFIAGPVAATIMAELGADVVKVEPPEGDKYRGVNAGYPHVGPRFPWTLANRNKRGVAIDLRKEDGQRMLHALVRDADVFVTNLPIDRRVRLGVEWERLEALNPRLIYASVTAYGETGDEGNRAGFDSTALWARSGLMDLLRPTVDAAPVRSLPGMGDHPTGVSLFGAVMAALYRRERTGRGGMVSTSLLANGVWINALPVQAILSGTGTSRPPRTEANDALGNHYRCRDDRWFMLPMASDDAAWKLVMEAIASPNVLEDVRFATHAGRLQNARALIAALDALFAERDWAEWRELFERGRVPAAVVERLDDIAADTQMTASGALVPIDPANGSSLVVSGPVTIGGEQKVAAARAPAIGEHTTVVLREAGVAEDEIRRLLATGVLAQAGG